MKTVFFRHSRLSMGFAISSAAAAASVRQFQIEEALSAGILRVHHCRFQSVPEHDCDETALRLSVAGEKCAPHGSFQIAL
jgi:hypothetical protein